MNGVEKFRALYPNREENVYFCSHGCNGLAHNHRRQWERTLSKMSGYVENAVQEGAVRFFCQGIGLPDAAFIRIVGEYKRKHPTAGVELMIWQKDEGYENQFEHDAELMAGVDGVHVLFTSRPRISRVYGFEATFIQASARVIGYVRPCHLLTSQITRACQTYQASFFNICSDPIIEARAIMEELLSLPDLHRLVQDWGSEQNRIFAQMQKEYDVLLVDQFREINEKYKSALISIIKSNGVLLISEYADELVLGIPGYMQRSPSANLTSRRVVGKSEAGKVLT